jgi:hypothetical protein
MKSCERERDDCSLTPPRFQLVLTHSFIGLGPTALRSRNSSTPRLVPSLRRASIPLPPAADGLLPAREPVPRLRGLGYLIVAASYYAVVVYAWAPTRRADAAVLAAFHILVGHGPLALPSL